MQKDSNKLTRNAEGYQDITPYEAIKHIGVEYKANRLMLTMCNVARLAGFTLESGAVLVDRNGVKYTYSEDDIKALFKHKKNDNE